MTYYNDTPMDAYPSPERELRASLVPLRDVLILSGALVLGLAVGGYGF